MTRCDRAQCKNPVVGTMRMCRDGIRRAMCAHHTLVELKRLRAFDAMRAPALRPAIPEFRKQERERSDLAVKRQLAYEAERLKDRPVCNCTYYGGRLLRACNRHAKVGT